jgi:hypothetical protein
LGTETPAAVPLHRGKRIKENSLALATGQTPGQVGLKRESLKEFLELLDIQQVSFKMSTCGEIAYLTMLLLSIL